MYKRLANKIREKTTTLLKRHQNQQSSIYLFRKRVPNTELVWSFPRLIKKTMGLGVYYSALFSERLGFRLSSSPLLYKKERTQAFFSIIEGFVRNRSMLLQSTLKKQVSSSINFKVKRGFVSGLRHSQRLPSRGQRTKTNSRTNKNRRSLG